MSLKLRLLSTAILLTSSLFANSSVDKFVTDFQSKRIKANPQIVLNELNIFLKKELDHGWYGYIFEIKANINGQSVEAKDILFSDGKMVTSELYNPQTARSLKDSLTPSLNASYYDDEHLVVGNKNAKNKVVVFSDPLCAFCVDFVPEIFQKAKQNKDIAVYYYHFPLLSIHPASDTIVKAMLVAKNKGIKEVEEKIYKANLLESISTKESDESVILKAVNKALASNISLNEIKDSKIALQIEKDMKLSSDLMIQGTPTIYVNGEIDKTRKVFEGL